MTANIVDSGATRTHFAIRVDTSAQTPGPDGTIVASIPADQLLMATNVKTMGLLNPTALEIGHLELAEPTGAEYGITVGTSAVPNEPDAINTPTRALIHDQATNITSAFHAVHTTGAAFDKTVLPIHKDALEDSTLPWKAAHRWQVDPDHVTDGPYEVMTDKNVDYGVTKSTVGNETKYLITDGTPGKRSAIKRLIDLPGNSSLCNGRLKPGNRTEVTLNGQTAIVMSEADFNSIAGPLRKSLKQDNPLENGLHFHFHQTNDASPPSSVLLPFTLVREPLPLEGHDKPWVTTDDLARALPNNGGKSKAAPKDLESVVHPSAPKGSTAVLTPLDTE